MTRTAAPEASPTEEGWATLGSVLLATLYLWILAWLLLFVVVPAVGLGWHPVVITSGSMEPLIRPGDVVLTGDVPPERLGPGTVITFEDPARNGSLTTHRIVGVTSDGDYRTRGDANGVSDSTPVPPDAVVGVGRLLVPMIGLPPLWLSGGSVLFAAWLGATLAAAVVAARRVADTPRSVTPRRSVRPHAVQGAIVTSLARIIGGHLARVAPAPRPPSGRIRAWSPLIAISLVGGAVARTPLSLGATATVLGAVIALDPGGPHLRVGRWAQGVGVGVRRLAVGLPQATGHTRMAGVAVLAMLAIASVGRSTATFTATTTNSGSSFAAAATFSVCPGPGSATVLATTDTYVDQEKPTENFSTTKELVVRSLQARNTRALLTFDLPVIPDGCEVSEAWIQLYTVTSKQGRTYELVRTDTAFDASTATWVNQPTATGAVALGQSGPNGPTLFWATEAVGELYTLGNTGVVIRDSVENDGGTSTNKFNSLEGKSELEKHPQLIVSWG